MINVRVVGIIFIFLTCILLISPSSAWLSGFEYKKEHTLSYSGTTTLNNYQVKFVFWNTTGTDSGENCYLGNHITQPDWDDLRITTTTDGICDIWIQEKGTNYAIVWCEVPYIYPGSDTRLFIYYGKPVATSVSDGDATFRFWGTFEQIPLNIYKWGYTGNYTQYLVGGTSLVDVHRNLTSGESRIYSLDVFAYATGYELIGRLKFDLINESYFGFISGSRYLLFRTDAAYDNMIYTTSKNVASPTHTNISNIYTGFRIFQIQRPPSGSYVRFLVNGSQVSNHTTDIPTTTMPVEIGAYALNSTLTADWLFLKRYVDPEPSHAVWDSEVVETAPNARFEADPRFGTSGTTVYFSDISTGVVDSWAWDINHDGVTDFTTKNCNYTYITPGYYDVELDVTNVNGTSTETKYDYIYIYESVTPTPTPTPCPSCPECVTTTEEMFEGVSTGVIIVIIVVVLAVIGLAALKIFTGVVK